MKQFLLLFLSVYVGTINSMDTGNQPTPSSPDNTISQVVEVAEQPGQQEVAVVAAPVLQPNTAAMQKELLTIQRQVFKRMSAYLEARRSCYDMPALHKACSNSEDPKTFKADAVLYGFLQNIATRLQSIPLNLNAPKVRKLIPTPRETLQAHLERTYTRLLLNQETNLAKYLPQPSSKKPSKSPQNDLSNNLWEQLLRKIRALDQKKDGQESLSAQEKMEQVCALYLQAYVIFHNQTHPRPKHVTVQDVVAPFLQALAESQAAFCDYQTYLQQITPHANSLFEEYLAQNLNEKDKERIAPLFNLINAHKITDESAGPSSTIAHDTFFDPLLHEDPRHYLLYTMATTLCSYHAHCNNQQAPDNGVLPITDKPNFLTYRGAVPPYSRTYVPSTLYFCQPELQSNFVKNPILFDKRVNEWENTFCDYDINFPQRCYELLPEFQQGRALITHCYVTANGSDSPKEHKEKPEMLQGLLRRYAIRWNRTNKSDKTKDTVYSIPGFIRYEDFPMVEHGLFEYAFSAGGKCYHRCFTTNVDEKPDRVQQNFYNYLRAYLKDPAYFTTPEQQP